jgi:hypothetical protein
VSFLQAGKGLFATLLLLSATGGTGCGTPLPDLVDGRSESKEPRQISAPALIPRATRPEMTERFIIFDNERVHLTLAYLRAHSAPNLDPVNPAGTFMEPKVVVLHWTGGSTAASTLATFAPSRLRGRANLQGAGALNVSAHFLVDRDGGVTQLLETTRVGRHTIGLNHISIGIENVGYEPDHPLTDAQVQANATLIRWLHARHGITYLIGHYEYREMEGHPYFVELDPNYRTAKVDPGAAFVTSVFRKLEDLRLHRASSLEGEPSEQVH